MFDPEPKRSAACAGLSRRLSLVGRTAIPLDEEEIGPFEVARFNAWFLLPAHQIKSSSLSNFIQTGRHLRP